MELQLWPDLVSLLEKLNGWILLVVLVMSLLIIDLVKKRRPRNFPPGPQLFPLVGTFVDFRQPLHLALQKVRAPWTFSLLTISYPSMTLVTTLWSSKGSLCRTGYIITTWDRWPFLVLSLAITSSSRGVGWSNGKEIHNGGRPTHSSFFSPIWLWPFPSGPQKGLRRAGPGWGTDEKCCVTAELFGDHLWKLFCHCLCSGANSPPHHICKKHFKSWVMSCGFFCVAERGSDLSGKVSTPLTPIRDKKREILYMLSIFLWKGRRSSDMMAAKILSGDYLSLAFP